MERGAELEFLPRPSDCQQPISSPCLALPFQRQLPSVKCSRGASPYIIPSNPHDPLRGQVVPICREDRPRLMLPRPGQQRAPSLSLYPSVPLSTGSRMATQAPSTKTSCISRGAMTTRSAPTARTCCATTTGRTCGRSGGP